MSELHDTGLHEIARALYYVKHGDWGYDPGSPKHRKWFERAERFAQACPLRSEYAQRPERAGPEGQSVRIVGAWRRDPSPARDLRSAS